MLVKDLVVVETRRSLVESDVLAGVNVVVRSSCLEHPLRSGVFKVILDLVSG